MERVTGSTHLANRCWRMQGFSKSKSTYKDAEIRYLPSSNIVNQECLELETDVENSEYIYWWKPFNLANVVNT